MRARAMHERIRVHIKDKIWLNKIKINYALFMNNACMKQEQALNEFKNEDTLIVFDNIQNPSLLIILFNIFLKPFTMF
jgi:hypothetical protein